MREGPRQEFTVFNRSLKILVGVALIVTASYLVLRLKKKRDSEKRLARMEGILDKLEKEAREKMV